MTFDEWFKEEEKPYDIKDMPTKLYEDFKYVWQTSQQQTIKRVLEIFDKNMKSTYLSGLGSDAYRAIDEIKKEFGVEN